MSAELGIISYVVRNGGNESLVYLIDQGVVPEYFHSPRAQRAFKWMLDQWTLHSQVPSEERFSREFPSFEAVPVVDPLPALVEELRNAHAISVARDIVPKITAEFGKDKEDFELPTVLELMGELQEKINLVQTVNEIAVVSDRLSTYRDVLLSDATPGIPTGFGILDEASAGWQDEQFIVLGAGPKRFKTMFLIHMAIAAARNGRYVSFTSHEMSNDEIMQRIVCLGAHVSLTHIQRKKLTGREFDRVEEFTDEFKSWEGDIMLIHDASAATTLHGLTAQIRSLSPRPEALYIDGMYMMRDESRKYDSEEGSLRAVSRGLKRLAVAEKIPIIGTTQALASRIHATKGMHIDSIGYTRAFSQDANVLLGIDRFDMEKNDAVLKVIAARSMVGMKFEVIVDLDSGRIIEGGEVHGDDEY